MAVGPLDRIVYKLPSGSWANRRNDSEYPSSVHKTQKEAAKAARRDLKREGGSFVDVTSRLGRHREFDVFLPDGAPDPPPDHI